MSQYSQDEASATALDMCAVLEPEEEEREPRLFAHREDLARSSYASPVDLDAFLRAQGCREQAEGLLGALDGLEIHEDARMSLAMRLAELCFFEQISTKIRLLRQRYVSALAEQFGVDGTATCELSMAVYLLHKLGALRCSYHLRGDFMEGADLS